MKQMFSNSMALKCIATVFFVASICQGFTSLVVSLAAQHKLDEDDINVFQSILQFVACFTTIGFGWLSSSKGVYSRIIQWLLAFSTLSFAILAFGMEIVSDSWKSMVFKLGMFLIAVCAGGIFPVIFDYCNNITFPLGEQAVSATVNIIAALSGVCVSKCVEILIEHYPDNKMLGNAVFMTMSALGLLVSLTLRG